jgi:hypothetical protein
VTSRRDRRSLSRYLVFYGTVITAERPKLTGYSRGTQIPNLVRKPSSKAMKSRRSEFLRSSSRFAANDFVGPSCARGTLPALVTYPQIVIGRSPRRKLQPWRSRLGLGNGEIGTLAVGRQFTKSRRPFYIFFPAGDRAPRSLSFQLRSSRTSSGYCPNRFSNRAASRRLL